MSNRESIRSGARHVKLQKGAEGKSSLPNQQLAHAVYYGLLKHLERQS